MLKERPLAYDLDDGGREEVGLIERVIRRDRGLECRPHSSHPPHHVGRTCHAAEIAAADTAVGPGKPAPAIPADNVSQPVAANNAFWALNKRPEALPRGIIGAQCRV